MKAHAITIYDLSLKIVKEEILDEDTLTSYQGQKARLKLLDGSTREGFIETSEFAKDRIVGLWTFTYLDESTHELVGEPPVRNELSWQFIPINLITAVDLILYSNPRWGVILTNKFEIVKA